MFIRLKREPTAKYHRAAAITLSEKRRHSPARCALRFRQSACDFLPDDHTAQSRRNDCRNHGVRKKSGKRLPKLLRKSRVLQHKRALHVRPAMQPAAQLKVAVPDSP